MKKLINKILLSIGYKLVKYKATKLATFVYEQQISINSNVIIQNKINYDFRVTPEDRRYVTIGEKCLINNATFTFESQTGEVKIGNNVYLGGVHFICHTKIEIEDDVMLSWGITLYDHDAHSIYWEKRKNDITDTYNNYLKNKDLLFGRDWSAIKSKPIRICSKVWIGFDVLILKGVTIGEGAVVAAKSVVTKDVPPWTVVAGNPAKVVKQLQKPKE